VLRQNIKSQLIESMMDIKTFGPTVAHTTTATASSSAVVAPAMP
jgi:hypothetical protein